MDKYLNILNTCVGPAGIVTALQLQEPQGFDTELGLLPLFSVCCLVTSNLPEVFTSYIKSCGFEHVSVYMVYNTAAVLHLIHGVFPPPTMNKLKIPKIKQLPKKTVEVNVFNY